jgi:DNA polymerase-3 subunit gamma/tau
MLSKQAFNGLLKTLEEPPEHVKFLFATTEIDKVPVTVRSRCQRFDLRRIESHVLVRHLARICAAENVAIEDEALTMIARAAEGSVRDALSLLDQAIANGTGGGHGKVLAENLRQMLGLADRARIIDLFEQVMSGRIAEALTLLKDLHDSGGDPAQILSEFAEFVHFVTRLKLVPETEKDISATQEERERGAAFAAKLSMPVLTRTWQLLLKGLQELKDSPRPLASADMVLVRLAYAADQPSPDEVLRRLNGLSGQGGRAPAAPAPSGGGGRGPVSALSAGPVLAVSTPAPVASAAPAQEPRVRLHRFEDLIALAAAQRDLQMKVALEADVRLVRFEEGRLEFSLVPGASSQLATQLTRKLQDWTGIRWMVALSSQEGTPSLREQAEAREAEKRIGVQADPAVQAILQQFPGAQIVAVRPLETPAEAAPLMPPPRAEGDEIAYADELYTEDDL